MSKSIEQEKEEIRSQLREFFRENMIEIDDDPNYIGIKCFVSGIDVSTETSISFNIKAHEYLFIDFFNKEIVLTYETSVNRRNPNVLKIPKNDLIKIYYFANTVFFWF